jgi:hypothetical protein
MALTDRELLTVLDVHTSAYKDWIQVNLVLATPAVGGS